MPVLKIVHCFAKQVVFLIKGSTRISYKMQGKQLHVFSQKNKSSYQIKLTFEEKHIFEIYLNHILSAFYTSSTLVSSSVGNSHLVQNPTILKYAKK